MTARVPLHREREGAKRQGEGSNDKTFPAYCPHPAFGHPLPVGEGSYRKQNGQTSGERRLIHSQRHRTRLQLLILTRPTFARIGNRPKRASQRAHLSRL